MQERRRSIARCGTVLTVSEAERVRQLETVLAALIDHIQHVGCYDARGVRLGNQTPAVHQARIVLGEEAWRRVMGE